MKFKNNFFIFFATGFYIGKIPFAPGTFGTLPGLILCYFLSLINWYFALIITFALIIFSIWVSGKAEKIIKKKDPGCIVIDEIAGIVVTMIFVPFSYLSVIIAFILFRIVDILKPFPIRFIDKKVKGGTGIVLDDVAAGILCNIILQLLVYYKIIL